MIARPSGRGDAVETARILADLLYRVEHLERTGQLAYSSIDNGALGVTVDGSQTMTIGEQYDGTSGAVVLTGPRPPAPSPPVVTSTAQGVRVSWDGLFADPAVVAPMDFARVDVTASRSAGFDPVATPPVSAVMSPRGGEVFVPAPPGPVYVALVTRSLPGIASLPSAVVSGTALDVAEVTDGVPPAAVPPVVTTSGLGVVFLRWTAVTTTAAGDPQTGPVEYEVHVSTSDTFAPSPSTLLTRTPATMVAVRTLPDGTPLVYDSADGSPMRYFFAVRAVDADGPGVLSAPVAGSMSKAGVGDLAAGSVTAEALTGVVVLGGAVSTRSLDADGKLTGTGTTLDPEGLFSYDSGNNPRFGMPNDPMLAAFTRGNSDLDYLDVQRSAALPDTNVKQGATVVLRNSVANPTTPPTVTIGYETVQFSNSDGRWENRLGWSADGSAYYTTRRTPDGGSVAERWTTTGALNRTGPQINAFRSQGCVVVGGDLYVIGILTATGGYRIYRYTASTLAYAAGSFADLDVPGNIHEAGTATIGYDAAAGALMVAYPRAATQQVTIARYQPGIPAGNSGAPLTLLGTTDTNEPYPNNLSCILYGAFDFPSAKYVWKNIATYQTLWQVTDAATLNQDLPYMWDVGMQAPIVGLLWTGARFASMSRDGVMRLYEPGTVWTDPQNATWHTAYTWGNSATQTESRLSPPATFTMRKRARVTVRTPALPGGVTDSRVYLARGSTAPAWQSTTGSTMTFAGVTSGSPTSPSRIITVSAFAPLDNPIVSGFGTGTTAQVIPDQVSPAWILRGSGSGQVGPHGWTAAGAATATTGRRATSTAQSVTSATWAQVTLTGAASHDSGDLGAGSGFTIPTAGVWMLSACVFWDGEPTATGRRVAMIESYTSGQAVGQGTPLVRQDVPAGQTGTVGVSVATDVHLASGTLLRLVVWQNSGSSLALLNSYLPAQFNARRVG